MGNVYRQDSQRLHELLDRASASDGATLLIPDLQRPYVWTPNQVTLLIDSLIRGWPFGTLLLWKVKHQELEGIPFRPFWTVVRRTGEESGAHVPQMNPPAEYHMVLDGQQRVQSLLLALGGDDWGFALEDRDWNEEINDRRARGRQAKYPHWSKASLCFDLKKFREEYLKKSNNLLAVDFRTVLTWAITDPQGGQSSYPRSEKDEGPLARAYTKENQKQLIRLSRLWRAAQPNPALMEAQFRGIIKNVLIQHGLEEADIQELLHPLGELMSTLRDVKLADVAYLELQPFDEQTWTQDGYNEAIVSIFTRLNTAGRVLTREEITLAWLKVGWETQFTEGKPAGACFAELQGVLADQGLSLETDELVSAASFVWAVADNEGRLLGNSDLLKGSVIRPMAAALSREWQVVVNSFLSGARALKQRTIEYGARGQFSSLYALGVLWAWIYTAESWKESRSLGVMARDDFEKRCQDSISRYLDRWIMCSQWAGVWSSASITTVEAYAKALTETRKTMSAADSFQESHQIWDTCFSTFLENVSDGAADHIAKLSATGRERVAMYRGALWIWHRLDWARWETSKTHLHVGKSKTSTEVDHTIAVGIWQKKVAEISDVEREEVAPLVNRLGNCALLEKNFNISKSDKSLKSFLEQIHEIIQHKIPMDAWCASLSIPQPMLDPDNATIADIKMAIENRDKEIKSDLIEFVRGHLARLDVSTPTQPSPLSFPVARAKLIGSSVVVSEAAIQTDRAGASFESDQELDVTPYSQSVTDLAGLGSAYVGDAGVRLILDHFANRKNNQYVSEIDSLLDALTRAGTPSDKIALIRAFRRMDALGIGRFVAGRRGYPTRFEWREKSLTARNLALSRQEK